MMICYPGDTRLTKWVVFIAGLASCVANSVEPNNRCPVECVCYDRWLAADCNARGLTRVPLLYNGTTHLYLGDNNLDALPLGSLQRTKNLEMLDLHHNLISHVDSLSLIGLHALQELYINNNHLSAFKVISTIQLEQLHTMDLSENHLTAIPVNLSIFAPNLQVLNISRNWIASAWFDPSYRAMDILHTIDLDHNHLGYIHAGDFSAISHLPIQLLSISHCNITIMEDACFAGFPTLGMLRVAGNHLNPERLKEEINKLNTTTSVIQLDLSRSNIHNATSKDFCSFPSLRDINLSYNKLVFWDFKLMICLGQLEVLNIQHNLLQDLDQLEYLQNIRVVQASGNELSNVTLRTLKKLEHINLSFNRFTVIPDRWITKCDTLKSLNLSHNQITDISSEAFQGLTLQELDISHNQLISVTNFGMVKPSAYYLSNNHITVVNEDAFRHMYSVLQTLDLSWNHLVEFPNMSHHNFPALQIVNLSHNQLGHFFAMNPHHQLYRNFRHLQILDLSHNNITIMPVTLLGYLPHLTSLYLGQNKLRDLSFLTFQQPSSISKLDVSRNLLFNVDVSTLLTLQYLEIVDFSYNPLVCKCNIYSFIQWLNSTIATVIDLRDTEKYSCIAPGHLSGRYILSLRPALLSCLHQPGHDVHWDLTVFAIVAGSTAIVSLMIAALFHYGKICHHIKSLHYKWQIRYRTVADVEFVQDPKV